MKQCKCSTHTGQNPLDASNFGKNKRLTDGLHYYCKECVRKMDALRYSTTKETIKARVAKWQKNNTSKVNNTSKQYRKNNPVQRKISTKVWRDNNKQLTCYLANKRRANKSMSTPPWAEEELIKQLYASCKSGYHVHHIVPLQSCGNVCGLHCLDNLIILDNKTHKYIHANQQILEESWYMEYHILPKK